MKFFVLSIWAMTALSWGGVAFLFYSPDAAEWGDDMGQTRRRKIWGMDSRAAAKDGGRDYSQRKAGKSGKAEGGKRKGKVVALKVKAEETPEIKRVRYAYDPLAFYKEIIAPHVKDKRTGLSRADSLGAIHDLFFDFLNLNEPVPEHEWTARDFAAAAEAFRRKLGDKENKEPVDYSFVPVRRYTRLLEYLPARNKSGEFPETWLYFPTLESKPKVQRGADGALSKMFKEQFWHGVFIRVKGTGQFQCALMPRGHLKTTIGTQTHTAWKITREPSHRELMRSVVDGKAQQNMGFIQLFFAANEKFRELYSALGPPEKRECPWNTEFMRLRTYAGVPDPRQARGADMTIMTLGMQSDPTGGHYDRAKLDDCVTETNYQGEKLRKAVERIENLLSVLDPGCGMVDIGTKWEENDIHKLFTDEQFSETIGANSSFMVVTALDADKKVKAPARYTPLEYGKPIWPEQFTIKELMAKRHRNDRFHYGQYFNQIKGTGQRTFDAAWIQRFSDAPMKLAKAKRLNIYIGFDTTSGKREQSGKLDYTAAFVLGQTNDRMEYYLLDAFKERLPAAHVARAFVDLALKWRDHAYSYRARSFQTAYEDNGNTNYLGVLLQQELRNRGTASTFSFADVSGKENPNRVQTLAQIYEEKRVFWPETLVVRPQLKGDPYNVLEDLYDEFTNYPGLGKQAGADDLLSAHGVSYVLCPMRAFKKERRSDEDDEKAEAVGTYTREEVPHSGGGPSRHSEYRPRHDDLHGYDDREGLSLIPTH